MDNLEEYQMKDPYDMMLMKTIPFYEIFSLHWRSKGYNILGHFQRRKRFDVIY